MIAKSLLTSLISKYYLNLNESVKWVINNNNLEINFISPSKDVVGTVICEDFKLDDSVLAVYDTKKLANLISICQGNLLLELEKTNTVATKLNISDMNFNLTYSLSDALLIPKVATVNEPDSWEVEIDLSSEDISHLIRAKSALSDVDNMVFKTALDLDGALVCEVVFGDGYGHSNKITYPMNGKIAKGNISVPFDSSTFKTILQANKDMETGTLKLSEKGLLSLKFQTETVSSEYFMIRRADAEF